MTATPKNRLIQTIESLRDKLKNKEYSTYEEYIDIVEALNESNICLSTGRW